MRSFMPWIGGKSQFANQIIAKFPDTIDHYIRDLYKGFDITAVIRQNNLSSGSYKELIIKNY